MAMAMAQHCLYIKAQCIHLNLEGEDQLPAPPSEGGRSYSPLPNVCHPHVVDIRIHSQFPFPKLRKRQMWAWFSQMSVWEKVWNKHHLNSACWGTIIPTAGTSAHLLKGPLHMWPTILTTSQVWDTLVPIWWWKNLSLWAFYVSWPRTMRLPNPQTRAVYLPRNFWRETRRELGSSLWSFAGNR